jgi:hypothetical protein
MYTDLEEEIANWIPKDDRKPDIRKCRPLIYFEVMRKMAVGIKKAQVLHV